MKINRECILEALSAQIKTVKLNNSLTSSLNAKAITMDLVNIVANYFLIGNNPANVKIHPNSCVELCGMIENSKSLDWLLYLTKKRYRDHFQHQFFVGALGWIFLNTCIDDNKTTLKKYISDNSDFGNGCSVEKTWWIASLLHDHAYPLSHLFSTMPVIGSQTHGNHQKSFEDLYKTYNLYSEELLKLFEVNRAEAKELLKGYLSCFFNKNELSNLFQSENNINDHGLWGAVNILVHMAKSGWPFFQRWLVCEKRSPGSCNSILNRVCSIYNDDSFNRDFLCLKHAIRAIAIHNCEDFAPIDLKKDPIGFLLVLCDEMQEWDRHTIIKSDAKVESEYIELKGIKEENATRTFTERLVIHFCFDANNLVDNDWDYKKFFESKRDAFSRLKVPDDFLLKQIEFKINVPFSLDLLNNPSSSDISR